MEINITIRLDPGSEQERQLLELLQQLMSDGHMALGTAVPSREEVVKRIKLEELELSTRILLLLRRAGLEDVGDIMQHTEKQLLKLSDFGQSRLDELRERLSEHGVSLEKGRWVIRS